MDGPALAATFRSLEHEVEMTSLPVSGELPRWLSGALIRNGPGRFEAPGYQVRHFFDGFALLQRFGFHDGTVSYRSRFLRSPLYRQAMSGRRMGFRQFGASPARTLVDIVRMVVAPRYSDNAGVNVIAIDGRALAVTETPFAVEFDARTLATRGRFEYPDDEACFGQTTTAHPLRDDARGELVNLVTKFNGRDRYYRFYRIRDGRANREPIATLPLRSPSYIHSFGMSTRHLVLAEFPLLMDPLRMLLGEESYIGTFRWRREAGTRVRVVERDTGRVVASVRTEACFAFHHLAAFEDGEDVVVDLCAYPDHDIIRSFYYDELARPDAPRPVSRLVRWRIGLRDGTLVRSEPLAVPLEFASIAPSRQGLAYRYAYGVGSSSERKSASFDRLIKADLQDGSTRAWAEDGCRFGEPVFVPAPHHLGGATAEDDGVVLALAHRDHADSDLLVVLDAATWRERARVTMPGHVPFGFHGSFFPEQ